MADSITIRKTIRVAGVLTDVTSVVLADATDTFGIKRNDTDAVVVADDTAMTNEGTGLYSHTFTVPANDLIFTVAIEWLFDDETQAEEYALVGPTSSATNLVTLTELKTYLNITVADFDTQLTQALVGALSWADVLTNRTLLTTAYTEYFDGAGDSQLIMPNYPITAVARVSIGSVQGLTLKSSTSDATHASVSVSTTGVTLTLSDGANAGSTTHTFADNTTLADMATAIASNAGTWTASALDSLGSFRSSVLRPVGGLFCQNAEAILTIPDQAESDLRNVFDDGMISLDTSTGRHGFFGGAFHHGLRNVYVEYTAGYTNSTAPGALKQTIMEIAGDIYAASAHDPSLKSERLGDYAWAAADSGGAGVHDIRARYASKLGPFLSGTY